MKKLFIIFILLTIAFNGLSFAADQSLTFTWEQVIPSDMGGWTIYYGLQSGNFTNQINIPYDTCDMATDPPSCQSPAAIKMITGGEEATYYFVMSAYDTSNNESGYSNEVSKELDFLSPDVPVRVTVTVPLEQ